MAWNIHWQCCFQSFEGVQYAVNVYEQDYDESVVPLTGAAEPFVTQEDDDDNIFTPIRVQTGYLRVIDTDGTLLEDMIPSNNTEKLVRLVTGTYSNGTFTQDSGNDSVKWQGFLQAHAYTQPWDNQANVLELPVKSLLGALEDIQIPDSRASQETRIAGVVARAFTDLLQDNGATAPYGYVYSVDDGDMLSNWLTARVQWAVFFSEETVNNEGDSYQQLVGVSYYEALEMCLSLFGLTAREDGMNLYFVHYDQTPYNMQCKVLRYLWSAITSMAGGGSIQVNNLGDLTATDMLAALTFKGADNVAGFLQGARSAKVEVKLDGGVAFGLELPETTEDASGVIDVQNIYKGHVYVQPHGPRTNSIETFTFSEYQQVGASGSNRVGSSTYAKCLANSVLYRPLYDPHYSSTDNLHTGAFPCRWYYRTEPTQSPSLVNGLFLNQQYLGSGWSFTPDYCYSLQSALSYRYHNGYLRINMKCYNFMRGVLAGDSDKLYFGEFTTIWSEKPQTKLYFILTWGTKEWNGTAWVTHSGNYNTFTIDFDGASVKTNKTDDTQVEETDGWFIPITEEMSGAIRLYILNVGSCETEIGMEDAHSRIIADLEVNYTPVYNMVTSKRTSNTYRETIMQSGFSQEQGISLNLGTMNNNIDSMALIKSSTTEYIEQMTYYTGTNTTTTQRPELRLLARMVRYYGTVRRTFTGVVQRGLDVMLQRYMYIGFFFGIRAKTNWRDDTEEVKFIEV